MSELSEANVEENEGLSDFLNTCTRILLDLHAPRK